MPSLASIGMWRGHTVGIVLPTYSERNSIREVITGFERIGIVDEIIVVNNNAAEGTSEEVAATTAIELHEPRQGYGAAIRRGIEESRSDLIALCEPDGTFTPSDLLKLLPFSAECDVVYGSRTVTAFIWHGANMGRVLRWGNWAVAKLLEVLFNTAYLSDVGCTFRVMKRPAAARLLSHAHTSGSEFGLELMIIGALHRFRTVQVPVNYTPRVGKSSVTGHLPEAILLGARMVALIVTARVRRGLYRRLDSQRSEPSTS